MRLIVKTSSVTSDFFYVFSLILSLSTCSQSLKKMCVWELLGANVLKWIQSTGEVRQRTSSHLAIIVSRALLLQDGRIPCLIDRNVEIF